ncbi:hypothetical protein I4F81_008755 [Pyropia yezoensis]|uniref:Uncharacterized protein n=1 Tax=Pyropia yezoensis TaxID=2788 RepID=A0ACC3C7P1_PYRYE|nr:hypothetical protein I4F81_008755 [Neopyropia yezoensis]
MQLDAAAAGVVVEELAANVPEAFARVNPGAAATAAVLCATAAAGVTTTAAALPVRRAWFDHLSFLLATVAGPSAADAVAAWRSDPVATLPLGPLLASVATGLARPASDATPGLGSGVETADRVVEVRSLERQTLLRRLRRLTLVACTDVTLFVAATTSLSVLSCERVAVHAAARRLLITNTFNSTFYMAVNAAPVVVGDSRGLRFSPYNAVYPAAELSAAAVAAGVDGTVNAWRDYRSPPPKGCGSGAGTAELAEAGVATVVPPDELIPFSVPTLEADVDGRDGGGGGGRADSPPRDLRGAAPVADGAAAGAPAAATSASATTVPPGGAARDLRPSLLAVAAPLPAEYRASLERRVEEFEALRRVVCSFELRPVGGGGAPVAAAAPSSTSAGEPQAGAAKAATASPSQGDAGRPAGAAADGTTTPAGAPEAAAAAGAVPTPNGPFAGAPPTASVHSVVTAHFREWLSSSNNMRQLQELVALTPEQQLQ